MLGLLSVLIPLLRSLLVSDVKFFNFKLINFDLLVTYVYNALLSILLNGGLLPKLYLITLYVDIVFGSFETS